MAQTWYLRNTASDLGGTGQKQLAGTRGAASTTAVTATATSGTNIQVTTIASGGQALTWFTPPLQPVTISGTVTVNIRGLESSGNANAKAGITIERASITGAVLGTIVANTAVPTTSSEYTTSDTAKNATFTATSQTLASGNRVKITLFVKNQGTMASGYTVTNSYDGPTASAAGDTYVTFIQDLLPGAVAPASPLAGLARFPAPGPVRPAIPAATTGFPPPILPRTSPGLEISGFGSFPGIPAGSAVTAVTVKTGEFQSSAPMGAATIELWDGADTKIGAAQPGTASTSSGNVSTATFTGVTQDQLPALRVRLYAHQGLAAQGAVESVDWVSLTVSYTPQTDATANPGNAPAAGTAPAASAVTTQPADIPASPALAAGAAPAPTVAAAAGAPAAAGTGAAPAPAPAVTTPAPPAAGAGAAPAAAIGAQSTGWLYPATATALTGAWANLPGAQGATQGDPATWTTTATGTGTLELSGYAAQSAVPAGATPGTLTIWVRHAEDVPAQVASVTAQAYAGTSPRGAPQALAASGAPHDDTITVTGLTWDDLADLRIRVTVART